MSDENSIFEEMEATMRTLEKGLLKMRADFDRLQRAGEQISKAMSDFGLSASAQRLTPSAGDTFISERVWLAPALHEPVNQQKPLLFSFSEKRAHDRGHKGSILELLKKNKAGLVRSAIAKQLKENMGVRLNSSQLSNALYYLTSTMKEVVREGDGRYRLK